MDYPHKDVVDGLLNISKTKPKKQSKKIYKTSGRFKPSEILSNFVVVFFRKKHNFYIQRRGQTHQTFEIITGRLK